jgi:hypothetical protein
MKTSTSTHGRRLVVLLLATLTLFGLGSHLASARTGGSTAQIACANGRVLAYAPDPRSTQGTYQWDNLDAYPELLRWDGSAWRHVLWGQVWKGSTNQFGTMNVQNGSAWTLNGYPSQNQPFTMARGYYYAVVSTIVDSVDGTRESFVDRTTQGAQYCFLG